MDAVVSDSGPIHYLVLIEAIDILPQVFGRVLIPEMVAIELSRPATPEAVRAWVAGAPAWFERRPTRAFSATRNAGEREAIGLAKSVGAQMLLIDDRDGYTAARASGLETTGTLGVLVRAAQLNLLELKTAFERLSKTNFRCSPEMLDALLAQHDARSP